MVAPISVFAARDHAAAIARRHARLPLIASCAQRARASAWNTLARVARDVEHAPQALRRRSIVRGTEALELGEGSLRRFGHARPFGVRPPARSRGSVRASAPFGRTTGPRAPRSRRPG